MKILITSKSFGRYAPDAVQFLEENGFELTRGSKPTMTPEEIAKEVPGFDALIVGMLVASIAWYVWYKLKRKRATAAE